MTDWTKPLPAGLRLIYTTTGEFRDASIGETYLASDGHENMAMDNTDGFPVNILRLVEQPTPPGPAKLKQFVAADEPPTRDHPVGMAEMVAFPESCKEVGFRTGERSWNLKGHPCVDGFLWQRLVEAPE